MKKNRFLQKWLAAAAATAVEEQSRVDIKKHID
jgi:hypothetical protein